MVGLRAKVKWANIKAQRPMAAGFYSNPHTHGCAQCDFMMPNCSCDTPDQDPHCMLCLAGRERPFWPKAWMPRGCCVSDSTPVQKGKANELLLAGTRQWFRCRSCGRCFGFDPSKRSPPLDRAQWQQRFGPLPVTPTLREEWSEFMRRYG